MVVMDPELSIQFCSFRFVYSLQFVSIAEFAYSIGKTIKSRKMDAFSDFKFDYVNWGKVSDAIAS